MYVLLQYCTTGTVPVLHVRGLSATIGILRYSAVRYRYSSWYGDDDDDDDALLIDFRCGFINNLHAAQEFHLMNIIRPDSFGKMHPINDQ